VFIEIFVMTKGKYETATVVYYMYDTGLTTNFKFGYASAIAWSLFVLVALISIAQFFLLRRKESIW
jgi:ABC-type sugar transport system permease subunit